MKKMSIDNFYEILKAAFSCLLWIFGFLIFILFILYLNGCGTGYLEKPVVKMMPLSISDLTVNVGVVINQEIEMTSNIPEKGFILSVQSENGVIPFTLSEFFPKKLDKGLRTLSFDMIMTSPFPDKKKIFFILEKLDLSSFPEQTLEYDSKWFLLKVTSN